MLTSRASGERVEDLSQRTESVQVFANPDGTWTQESATGPERVKDAAGEWHDLDLTLVKGEDGKLRARYAATEVVFSAGGDRALATIRAGDREFVWRLPAGMGQLPTPVVEGGTATYPNVRPGQDLLVQARPTGFVHFLVLKQRPVGPVHLTFPVEAKDASVRKTTGGGLVWSDAEGRPLVTGSAPVMWDASAAPESASVVELVSTLPVEAERADLALTQPGGTAPDGSQAGAQPLVTVSAGAEFLADPATVYPVVIDPSYGVASPAEDTFIQHTGSYTSGSTVAGWNHLRSGSQDSGAHIARTFVKFADLPLSGKTVLSAYLRMRNTRSLSCTSAATIVHRVTSAWTSGNITWAGQPSASGSPAPQYSPPHGGPNGSACAAHDWAIWNVLGMVQAWQNGAPNYGFRLLADAPTSNGNYREYRSKDATPDVTTYHPKLSMTFNSWPNTPVVPTVTPGNASGSTFYTSTTTPKFTTTVVDPNGGTVRAVFEVKNSAGARVTTCASGYVASGSQASCTVPALPDGGSYTVRATAHDGSHYTGGATADTLATYSSARSFVVAAAPPAAPVVTCPDPYTNGSWQDTAPGTDVTCTVTATGTGPSAAAWITTVVDGVTQRTQITPSSDPAVAKSTVTVSKAQGGHLITATGESLSGKTSAAASHALGWGAVGMRQPAAGSPLTTTDTVAIEAVGPASNGGSGTPAMTLRWRVAGTNLSHSQGWNTVAAADVQNLSVSNTAAAGVKATAIWDSRTATADTSSGTGTITLPLTRPVLLDVQACIDYPGDELAAHCTWTSGENRVLRVAHAFGGNYPVTDVPGGQVALWTGELAIGDSDATVAAPVAELSVSRTAASFAGPAATVAEGVFGPGWRASLDGPEAGLGGFTLIDSTRVDGTLVLDDAVDVPMVFGKTATPARRTSADLAAGDWVALDEDTELAGIKLNVTGTGTGTTVTVAEADGTATKYTAQSAPTTTADGVFVISSVTEPAAEGTTSFTRDSEGRVTRMLAPVPAGVTCPGTGALPAGCRALEIEYATLTTATIITPGDVAGQVRTIQQVVGGATEERTALATYAYDGEKRLVSATDPRNNLTTKYTYDGASDRIASITPAGLKPINYLYGTGNKVARVNRDRPTGDPAGGTATLASFVYDVPRSGTGLPDLTATAVGTWGQTEGPTYAAAVFGPDQPLTGTSVSPADVASSLWVKANLSYTDADGRTLNTASHGAGAWQYTSTSYDIYDNVVRSLDAGEIAAVKAGDLVASQAGTTTRYNNEQSLNGAVVLPAGSVPVETWGTGRWILTQAGQQAWVRPHSLTELDEGAPNNKVNPATGQRYALPTTVSTDAVDPGTGNVVETYSVVKTDYSTAVAADAEAGWRMGLAGTTTTVMGSEIADIVAQARYDTAGRLLETRQPKSADGTTAPAGIRKTAYYTAGTHPSIGDCGGKPAWAGLECQTYYAGAPSAGPDLVTTRVTGYNTNLQSLTTQETSGAATRTTTNTYATDGRLTKTSTVATGLAGSTPVGETSYAVDPATGLPTTTSTTAAGGNPGGTITLTHDDWGRQTKYAPAAGEETSTVYDAAGRVQTVTDPKGSLTYTYDGTDAAGNAEHRGLPTKLSVSRASGAALEFTGAYDADGGLVVQKLPGGVTQRFAYDAAGEPTGLTYSGQVAIIDPETEQQTGTDPDGAWLAWSQHNDATGRVRREWTPNGAAFTGDLTGAAATGYTRDYTYDRAARLVEVKDRTSQPGQDVEYDADGNPIGTAPACQTRLYGFDANGNRTSLTRRAGNPDGTCATTGGTTTSWTYDTADRLTTGAGGTGSYSYDQLGRVTSLPAADSPKALAAGSATGITHIGLGYYDTDAIRTLTQDGTTTSYGLDPAGRRSTENTGPTGGAATSTVTRHYTDDSDNPTWIDTVKDGATTVTRFIETLGGDLGAEVTGTGTAKLNLANLHGDITTTVTLPATGAATGIDGWTDADEYGNPRSGSTTAVGGQLGYSWLGAKQRALAPSTGLMLMGVRVYNPASGQFTSVDPVFGGGSTAYGYPTDPVGLSDLDGRSWGRLFSEACKRYCGKALKYGKKHAATAAKYVGRSVRKAASSSKRWITDTAKNAGSRYGGKDSLLFGKGTHGYRKGLLNRGPVRLGWGWKGPKSSGRHVFRIGMGRKGSRFHFHIDLF